MKRQKKSYLWLFSLVLISGSLLLGSVIGGVVGYTLAKNLDSSQTGVELQTVSAVVPGIVPAVDIPVPQPVIVTDEPGTVSAVSAVLPAVVTVLTQDGFGGGSGSGFFISQEGYVVTNNHVIENSSNISVVYATGGRAQARLVGTAPEFDLAVIKVDGPVPAIALWGDSSEQPLGVAVIAIGSALGEYRNSVTQGILSGFNRQLGNMGGLLQTDAAINQGNSGGPLINVSGQVIGINTLVVRGDFTPTEGLGFAIPSNTAKSVVRHLIENGAARHPFIGIRYQALNPQLSNELGLSISEGALLEAVFDSTPAAQANLRAGDVIVALNGEPVNDRNSLVSLLLEHVAGETVTLEVLRDGQTFQTQLTLGERA